MIPSAKPPCTNVARCRHKLKNPKVMVFHTLHCGRPFCVRGVHIMGMSWQSLFLNNSIVLGDVRPSKTKEIGDF